MRSGNGVNYELCVLVHKTYTSVFTAETLIICAAHDERVRISILIYLRPLFACFLQCVLCDGDAAVVYVHLTLVVVF